jgi:cation transport ATPase
MSFSHSNILHQNFEHERVDLSDHSEDEPLARNRDHKMDDQNALAGVIIGFFTTLLTGAACGLSWYLFWHHGSVPWLTNSIFITVALIAAIFGAVNCFLLRSNKVSDTASLLGTMLCIIAATYSLTAGFTMYLYRYWEYSWSLMAFANSDLKASVFGAGTFANVWSYHKTLMNSMCVLLLVACVGLLWLAYVQ